MSSLDFKQRELYSKKPDKADENAPEQAKTPDSSRQNIYKMGSRYNYLQQISPEVEKNWDAKDQTKMGFKQKIAAFYKKNKKAVLFFSSLMIVVIIGLVALFVVLADRTSFQEDDIEFNISGETDLVASNNYTYQTVVENKAKKNITDIKIKIVVPESQILKSETAEYTIDQISSNAQDSIEFEIQAYGAQGSNFELKALLEYKTETTDKTYTKEVLIQPSIISTPISVLIDGPQEVKIGETFSMDVEFKNNSDEDFYDLSLQMQYSDQFELVESDSLPDNNDSWPITELKANDRDELSFKLKYNGSEKTDNTISVNLGIFRDDELYILAGDSYSINSSTTDISIEQNTSVSNDIVKLENKKIDYIVEFTNNAEISLEELILTVKIEGEMVNFKTLDSGGGRFDATEDTIVWTAASINSLKLLSPGSSGSAEFSVELDENFDLNSSTTKSNFIIKTNAYITTKADPENQLSLNTKEIKVGTNLELKNTSFYIDPNNKITNTGPLPPKVNETTTYGINCSISNDFNNVKNAKLTMWLSEDVESWTDVVETGYGSVEYNDRTKELTWTIGNIPANTGYTLPTYDMSFQISIKPGSNSIGQSLPFVTKYAFTGEDAFTGEQVTTDETSVDLSTSSIVDIKSSSDEDLGIVAE